MAGFLGGGFGSRASYAYEGGSLRRPEEYLGDDFAGGRGADPRAAQLRLSEAERAAVKDESEALGRQWEALRGDLLELEEHKLRLEDEWRELEMERERLIGDRDRFEEMVRAEWFHVADPRAAAQRMMRLNVGGQLFEVSAFVLCRDRFSLLAAVCSDAGRSPVKPDTAGCYFFDRDWWLFRHVLAFLRDGVLPDNVAVLRDLFEGADFFRVDLLRREIAEKLTVLSQIPQAAGRGQQVGHRPAPLGGRGRPLGGAVRVQPRHRTRQHLAWRRQRRHRGYRAVDGCGTTGRR